MRVGLFVLLNHPGADREAVLAAGRAADACGFHSPPLYFGGNSEAALGRVARLGDGWLALGLTPEDLARHRRQLGRLLEREGRSFAQLDVAVMPPPGPLDRARLERYREAGATQLVAAPPRARGESLAAAIERLAAALLPL